MKTRGGRPERRERSGERGGKAGAAGRARASEARTADAPKKPKKASTGGGGGAGGTTRIVLARGKSKPFWVGHPWVFSGAIGEVQGDGGAGECVVLDERGNELGWGHYNPLGQIAVRLLWHRRTTDLPFQPPGFERLLRERIAAAQALRTTLGFPREGTNVYRLVNAEGDLLTGLIVDRLGDVLSVQLNSKAMYDAREKVVATLRSVTGLSRLVVSVTETSSKMESIPSGHEIMGEGHERIDVVESGLRYAIDLNVLQKTGFYADQRENRQRFGALCAGKTVLDAYCHLGGFGLAAARANASAVTQVDSSEPAILGARQAARMNGLGDRVEALTEDAVIYLKEAQAIGKTWDRVVVDPPKLAQGRGHIEDALQKYARINALAMASVAPGGLLLTCSCSRHVSPEEFGRMLTDAGHRLRRSVRLLEMWGQPSDHPTLTVAPEGRYLKAWLVALD